MRGFWLSLFMIFMAEMGEKTQVVALTLATQFNAAVVLAGVALAIFPVKALTVLLGGLVGKMLPSGWLQLLSGLFFIGFGVWTLRGDTAKNGNRRFNWLKSPLLIVAVTFFLAELGDKTMLGTATLATQYPFLPIWLGSSLGVVLADALAVGVGMELGRHLPEKAMKIGTAAIFLVVGAYFALQGLAQLWAVIVALFFIMLILVALFRLMGGIRVISLGSNNFNTQVFLEERRRPKGTA